MAEKTLSSGTLSLRFMQNARRTQHATVVEAEKAQVKDDAEWEVAREVREAWGQTSSSDDKSQPVTVTYETSYLPFLFPSLPENTGGTRPSSHDISATIPKGRRAFNKRGEEIIQESYSNAHAPSESQPAPENQPKDARQKRPISISGSGSLAATTKQVRKTKDASREAKRVIYDNSNVGTDLRPPPSLHPPIPIVQASNSFLRPSGVDGPIVHPKGENKGANSATPDNQVIGSARKGKAKRDQIEGDGNKPKKKSKLTMVE
ncbi:hypothetical protein SERLA73DRAFT_187686 [Serpula lacrymans var. lacrymans S7.3]|uniref:Uncharacterized protein n=2 Tax=Serpula lacrymans var. lacrymans TaxID=341189 RepID=F8QA58_SERL3|nr:uncharacterized protein SERLADRAFT_477443 [Serpula lacrymans var. lacrymans S7.9]EGN94648.1 hypothetical protein SERLA73DRAFT_187686 [Serpula lacrymans var. lacrymans S7.3]EGO20130.1 hypothetical protein SERLADRAFT_477443 [Serpula lacrymans var. lacrymans S7.9]